MPATFGLLQKLLPYFSTILGRGCPNASLVLAVFLVRAKDEIEVAERCRVVLDADPASDSTNVMDYEIRTLVKAI